jgi:hypothetical protein
MLYRVLSPVFRIELIFVFEVVPIYVSRSDQTLWVILCYILTTVPFVQVIIDLFFHGSSAGDASFHS